MQGDGADIVQHFTARAERYDRSSRWCTDPALLDLIFHASAVGPDSRVLDLACGTGLVSARFHGHVAHLVGVDITPAMAARARPHLDAFVQADAGALPFADGDTEGFGFDAIVCRQGLQFMDLDRVLPELLRVLRPGGRLVSADLHAYGPEDRDEYFEILRLRNPARRNFFVAGDMARQLQAAGFQQVAVTPYVSVEDVDVWTDNGAIAEARRQAVRAIYRDATPAFRALHAVEVGGAPGAVVRNGRLVDHMRFELTVGRR